MFDNKNKINRWFPSLDRVGWCFGYLSNVYIIGLKRRLMAMSQRIRGGGNEGRREGRRELLTKGWFKRGKQAAPEYERPPQSHQE